MAELTCLALYAGWQASHRPDSQAAFRSNLDTKRSQFIGRQPQRSSETEFLFSHYQSAIHFLQFPNRVKVKIKLNHRNKGTRKTCEILSSLRFGTENFLYLQTNYSFHDTGLHPPNCVFHFLVHRCSICFANGRNVFLFLCSLNSKLNKEVGYHRFLKCHCQLIFAVQHLFASNIKKLSS